MPNLNVMAGFAGFLQGVSSGLAPFIQVAAQKSLLRERERIRIGERGEKLEAVQKNVRLVAMKAAQAQAGTVAEAIRTEIKGKTLTREERVTVVDDVIEAKAREIEAGLMAQTGMLPHAEFLGSLAPDIRTELRKQAKIPQVTLAPEGIVKPPTITETEAEAARKEAERKAYRAAGEVPLLMRAAIRLRRGGIVPVPGVQGALRATRQVVEAAHSQYPDMSTTDSGAIFAHSLAVMEGLEGTISKKQRKTIQAAQARNPEAAKFIHGGIREAYTHLGLPKGIRRAEDVRKFYQQAWKSLVGE